VQARPTDVLGRLLTIQDGLESAPDEAAMALDLERVLRAVPGVATSHLYVRGVLYPPDEALSDACARFIPAGDTPESVRSQPVPGLPGVELTPLRTQDKLYGYLAVRVDGPDEFQSQRSFIEVVARIIACHLERRRRIEEAARAQHQLERLKDEAEDRILERTAVLAGQVEVLTKEAMERRRVEDELRRSQTRLAIQFEQMPVACITWDADLRVESWNPAAEKVFGFAASEAVGAHLYDCIVPKSAQLQVDNVWSRLRQGVTSVRSVNENVTKDGRTITCEWTNTPLRQPGGRVVGALAMAHDITERLRMERALERTQRALRTLNQGNEALVRARSEDQLLKDMCAVIVKTGGYLMASIGMAEHDEAKTVRPVAWAGREDGYLSSTEVSWADTARGRGPTGTAIRTGEPQAVQNIATSADMAPWRDEALKRGYASLVALPLKGEAGVFGALRLFAAEPDAFDWDELSLLVELAGDLSYGITALRTRAEHEASSLQLRRSMEATIEALAGMVELRDPYTAGHQRKVSQLASAIAREMGLSEFDVEGIRLAGVVHDIGKVHTPAEILAKPGKLSNNEFELIKEHPQAGHDIVRTVDFPWAVADMILQHHERMDGSGYPNGLKGKEILMGARILSVADVVEAMSSHRPYRPALGLDAAMAEIEKGRGRVYDAAVVDACTKLLRSGKFTFDAERTAASA
jgi:PAS domain S-box-containing protein/putative nucleotidyltransferase with HDIG domain